MSSVRQFLEKKLKLKVNEKKSAVARVGKRKVLGFSFFFRKGEVLIRIAKRALQRLHERLSALTRRTRSGRLEGIIRQINEYLRGWMGYFRLADTPSVFEDVDQWLRRRLRQLLWKRWKRARHAGESLFRWVSRAPLPRSARRAPARGIWPQVLWSTPP